MRTAAGLLVAGVVALVSGFILSSHATAKDNPDKMSAMARSLLKSRNYEAAADAYARLLENPDYEPNDPERGRWFQGYSQALYRKNDIKGARSALVGALDILTAQGTRTHPSTLLILGPLAVMDRLLGDAEWADKHCAEVASLKSASPKAPADFVDAVQKACPGLMLPLEPLLGGVDGEWERAKQIARQLNIEDSLEKREVVQRAAMWMNAYLRPDSALKVSPSWQKPLERSEKDTVAIFLTSKQDARGKGAFVPPGVERAIIIEESFLENVQSLPPNPVPLLGFQLRNVDLLVLVLLHEFAHVQAEDQLTYGKATCQQRRAMETDADLFAAQALRAALKGERGPAPQVLASQTVMTLVGHGWQYSSNRLVRELFPEAIRNDPNALNRAYCEGGPSHPAMELRLLEMYRTMMGSEYAAMFGEDALTGLVASFKSSAADLPSCGCIP